MGQWLACILCVYCAFAGNVRFVLKGFFMEGVLFLRGDPFGLAAAVVIVVVVAAVLAWDAKVFVRARLSALLSFFASLLFARAPCGGVASASWSRQLIWFIARAWAAACAARCAMLLWFFLS